MKSPLLLGSDAPHVHPRQRKRLSRCTLDCGFKTSESPALRGFVGGPRALATAALYLVLKSNGLHRPENLPVKFGFSPKSTSTNIAKKLPLQRCFKPLLIALFNFSHKRPTFAFTSESGYTLAFRRRIAHNGSHGETGAFRTGPLSLPSTRTARLRTSPGRVSERRTLPLWDLGREVLSKNAESLRDSDALMRVAVPRRRGPAGLRDLFRFCRNCGLYALRSGPFCACETWELSLPSVRFACYRNAGRPLVKTTNLPFSCVPYLHLRKTLQDRKDRLRFR